VKSSKHPQGGISADVDLRDKTLSADEGTVWDAGEAIGTLPYRLALAGGWIDQPFVSQHNPCPPGSMVVVCLHPTFRFMDRAGMATSTRRVAEQLWNGTLPDKDAMQLVHELYEAENEGKALPSGSQDMVGLLFPGVNRLDYDCNFEGGFFPCHVESCNDPEVAEWLEQVLHILPVAQRPEGYSPLGTQFPSSEWALRLSESGKACFDAIVTRDLHKLGASMNETMKCWEALLPDTVVHPLIAADLPTLLASYQANYAGAMYSGCGGGYLCVASDEPVPGAIKLNIRINGTPTFIQGSDRQVLSKPGANNSSLSGHVKERDK
jgi:hypothetical protein